jgi:hypothetical protein
MGKEGEWFGHIFSLKLGMEAAGRSSDFKQLKVES